MTPGRRPIGKTPKRKLQITIDPQLVTDIQAVDNNVSGFLETAGRDRLKKVRRDSRRDSAKSKGEK